MQSSIDSDCRCLPFWVNTGCAALESLKSNLLWEAHFCFCYLSTNSYGTLRHCFFASDSYLVQYHLTRGRMVLRLLISCVDSLPLQCSVMGDSLQYEYFTCYTKALNSRLLIQQIWGNTFVLTIYWYIHIFWLSLISVWPSIISSSAGCSTSEVGDLCLQVLHLCRLPSPELDHLLHYTK